jgi:hypothetical protein
MVLGDMVLSIAVPPECVKFLTDSAIIIALGHGERKRHKGVDTTVRAYPPEDPDVGLA